MTPLISIIIPTFNRADLLKESLLSVLSQIYRNWECIIVDDGSLDNTASIVKNFELRDQRFKYYQRPEVRVKGAASCRNYGLELAKGDLIQFLDDDDLLGENKLTEQIKLYKDPLTLITCKWGWFQTVDEIDDRFKHRYNCYKNYKEPHKYLETLGFYNEYMPIHNYLISKEILNKAGPWNEDLSNNDDAEFMTRIILQSSMIFFAPDAKVFYRTGHDRKLSEFDSATKMQAAIKSWKFIEYHLEKKMNLKNSFYVLNAKRNLSNIVQKKYPRIFKKELKFFSLCNWRFSLLRSLNIFRF